MIKKINKQSSFYKSPTIIGLVLIIVISGYFLFKSLSGEKKLKQLDKKLEQEKEGANKFNIRTVSPEEVFQAVDDKEVNLIDIRNSSEYNLKHIESSINVPFNNLKKDISKFNKNKKNIIIDKEDTTEGKILVDHFQKEGLDIAYLEGGILKYAQENYPLITSGNINNPTDLIKVTSISAEDVKKKLLNGQIFSFIDTRPEYLYVADRIDGSFNFPLEEIEKKKEELPVHKLLLYDSNPLRSFKAGVKLYDMGITNFYNCTDNYDKLKEILFSKNKK
jgi:rhodanese-related sulfurtransferase